jgi:hypothetical protein
VRAVSSIKAFEQLLWAVRYIIVVPVVAVAAAAVGVVVVTTDSQLRDSDMEEREETDVGARTS